MNLFLIMLGILIIFADQLTKHIVESLLYVGQSVPIVPQYFHITLVRNPGAMFGIMAHWRWFFVVVTIASLIILLIFMKDISKDVIFAKVGLALIMSGAVGNLIDRLRFGYVIDFIDFRVWPVFNIADIVLCLGAVFFLFGFFKDDLK